MKRCIALVLSMSLVMGACTSLGLKSGAGSDSPPLVNGYYVEPAGHCGEACPTFGKWRATASSDVFAEPEDDAEVIAHIAAGEVVQTAAGETRVRPLRGVVQKAGGGLTAGEVVYQLLDDGEGFSYDVWHGGQITNVETEGVNAPVVAWENRREEGPLSLWWVRVELQNGTKGWLRNPSDFDGMGPLG